MKDCCKGLVFIDLFEVKIKHSLTLMSNFGVRVMDYVSTSSEIAELRRTRGSTAV